MEWTAEQRDAAEQIERDLREWLEREMAKTPEEHRADGIKSLDERCEKLNALPLEERLRTLAVMHDSDYEAVEASIDDVTWRVADKDGVITIVTNMRFKRSIEQVYFTATVGPPDAAAA